MAIKNGNRLVKHITFASFKGGAGKTTAVMAAASSLIGAGKRVALIDTDENMPLMEWQENAVKEKTWSDDLAVYEADDMRAFEKAFEDTEKKNFDYVIIDTRGGGSDLNDACLINTNLVVIPSALTQLDMTQALSTFEHVIKLHQSMEIEIPTALLVQRLPSGKLSVSQKQDLETLYTLPIFETQLHSRDAFASLGKRGLLNKQYDKLISDPMKRISASHLATAMSEADALANDLLEALGGA